MQRKVTERNSKELFEGGFMMIDGYLQIFIVAIIITVFCNYMNVKTWIMDGVEAGKVGGKKDG